MSVVAMLVIGNEAEVCASLTSDNTNSLEKTNPICANDGYTTFLSSKRGTKGIMVHDLLTGAYANNVMPGV